MGGLSSFVHFAQSEIQMILQSHVCLQSTTAQTPGTPIAISQCCGEIHTSTATEKMTQERLHKQIQRDLNFLYIGRTKTEKDKSSPNKSGGFSRRLAEWQTFWKGGILNTNTKGQRLEAEALCTQLGGPLIRGSSAEPVGHQRISGMERMWKPTGNQQVSLLRDSPQE